jgi:hypothetical protein
LGDTWEYDGTLRSSVGGPGPAARGGASLFWDGQRIVLFGGYDAVVDHQDTWGWDGT